MADDTDKIVSPDVWRVPWLRLSWLEVWLYLVHYYCLAGSWLAARVQEVSHFVQTLISVTLSSVWSLLSLAWSLVQPIFSLVWTVVGPLITLVLGVVQPIFFKSTPYVRLGYIYCCTVLCPWWWAENSILAWVLKVLPKAELSLENLTTDLKDGQLMCRLMESLVPGVCPNPELLLAEEAHANWKLASRAAEFTLGVISAMERASGAVCESETPLDDHEVLITCLQALRYAVQRRDILQLPMLSQEEITEEIAIYQVIANGKGLKRVEVEQQAQFSLHLHTNQDIDLTVEVKSDSGSSCRHNITSSSISQELTSQSFSDDNMQIPLEYKVCEKSISVKWIPQHSCSHRVSLLWHGQHLCNSPYHCQVSSYKDKIAQESRAKVNSDAILSPLVEDKNNSSVRKHSRAKGNSDAILSPPIEDKNNSSVRNRSRLQNDHENEDYLISSIRQTTNAEDKISQEYQAIHNTGAKPIPPMRKNSVRKHSGLRNEHECGKILISSIRETEKPEGKPKATALTKGRKGRPPSPKPQDIFSTDDEDDEVLGRYGNTILEVRKGMVLENRRNWEKKQRNKEAHLSQNSVQRPKTLPFISKKNVALQYSSGHIMASPSISIPSTPSSEVIRMLTPPPDCPFTPEENKSFLQSIKGKVAEQRKRYDSIGSLGSSCDNLDESENCSQDEADVFTGSYTAGKVKERKKMWENKIKELQKKNEKPTSHGRLSNKKNKRSSKSELHKSFTSDEELDTLRKISRRVSRSGSLKYLLHNTTDGNIYIETTDDELIKNYVGDDTPPSSLEYSLDDHLDNVSHEFSSYFNEENGPKAPTRKKKKEQNSRMEVVTSSPQYPPGASKDLAIMLTTSSFNQKQLNPAGGLRCYLVHSAHGSNKTRSMSLPDLTAIVPSNYEDTFETGENYTEYKNKFASTRRFFESVSHDFASEESDINRECGDICNRCGPFKPKKTGDYYSDDGFERYLYVEKKHFLDIDCSTERSSSRNSIDQAIQTDKHYRSRDKGCQSSADSSPTHCPSCHHDLNLNSRPRKRKSMKTYDLIQLPKMKRKILKKRQGQHHNDISQSLPSSDIDVFESNTLRNNLGKQKPWDINPIDGNPWISSLNKQHSLPYEGMGMEPQTNKYSDEETKQHSLPYGGVGIREQSNNYSDDETNQHSLPYGGVGIREQSNNYSNDDDEESWSMRVKSYGMFGLRNPLPLVASLKDLSRNLPSPYPDAPQDILDDLDHSVFQNVPRGQVIHTLGGLYNKEYPHIPIRQHQRGTQHRYNKHHENLITHKDLRKSSLHSMPESWAKNKSVYSVGLFSDVNGDDNHNLENESIVPSRTLYSPVPLPRTKSLGLDDVQNKSSEVCDNNEYTINTNYYYNSNQQNNEEISKSEAEFIARNVGELKQRLDDEINCPISEYLNSVQDHEPHKHGMEHHMDYNEPSCPSSSDEDEQDQSLYNDQSMEDLTNEDFQKQSMRSSQDLKSCRAYGLGLEWGKVDRVNTFTIDTNGATSGEVTVSVEGPHEGSVSRTEVYPVDEDAGLYQVHYTVTTPSTYQLAITWAHQHIQGSPFACYVEE